MPITDIELSLIALGLTLFLWGTDKLFEWDSAIREGKPLRRILMMAFLGIPFFSMGVMVTLDYFVGPIYAEYLGFATAISLGGGILASTAYSQNRKRKLEGMY